MARTVGKVKSISGKAAVKTLNDQLHVLKVGEPLHENEMVYALGADSKVTLTLEGGRELTLNGYDEILLDKSVFTALEEGEALDVKALQQALAEALNPENMEETAAGQEVVGDANAGAEYADRNDARGNPSSYLTGTENNALNVTFDEVQKGNIAPIAFDDNGNAVEEGSGDDYDAPVVATGNVLENDTDDSLPNPPSDLDVTAVSSNDTTNPTSYVGGFFVIEGKYGTLVLNGETGEYTYTVDENNPTVDAMNIGDNVQESFSYVVNDGALGDSAVLTITINGTNDAPVATGEGGYTLSVDSDAALTNIAAYPTEGAAVKFIVETQAGETVTFNWQFNAGDYLPYNDFAFVGVDNGNLVLLSNVATVGNYGSSGMQTYTITFSEAGAHTITFGVSDYGDTGVNSSLNISNMSGGNLLGVEKLGSVGETGSTYLLTTAGASVAQLNSFLDTNMDIGDLINSMEGNEADASVAAEGNVLLNDTDVDNPHEQLSVVSVNGESVPQSEGTLTYQGMYGILEMDAKGNFTYTPYDAESETKGAAAVDALNIGDILQETFTYIISDNEEGGAKTDTAVLRVIIQGTNDAPVATADYGTSYEGNESDDAIPAEGNVLGGDYDVDNTNLSVVSVNGQNVSSEEPLSIAGAFGTLVIASDGSYTYTPYSPESEHENAGLVDALNEGETLTESFTYTISDNESGGAKTDSATLTLTIEGTNDAPVAEGDIVAISEERFWPLYIDVMENDDDVDSENVSLINAEIVEGNGWVTISNGLVKYYPNWFDNQSLNEGETKSVIIEYTIADDMGKEATSTLTVNISGMNDHPVAVLDFASGDENHLFVVNVLANDWDVDSQDNPSNFSLDTISYNGPGTASIVENQLQFAPGTAFDYLNVGEKATVSIWYKMSDDSGADSNWSKAIITLVGSNDGPVAVDDFSVADYSTYTIHLDSGNDWNQVTITPIGTQNSEVYFNNGNQKIGIENTEQSDSKAIDNAGTNEGIKFVFGGMLQHLEVKFDSFNSGQDSAIWKAMLGNAIVMQNTFYGNPQDMLVIDTGTNVFDTLVIQTPTGEHVTFYIDSMSGYGLDIDSALTVTENEPIVISESYLMANDSDVDSDTLNIINIDSSGTIGEVSIDADGNVTYDPAGRFDHLGAGEIGTDTFTYVLSDGSATDTATVTINIIGSEATADSSCELNLSDVLKNNFHDYDAGLGYDTVILKGNTNGEVDFSKISSQLENIEHLDLQNGSKTFINITPEKVAEMTDDDNYLRISGENNDSLELDGFTLDSETSANLDGYNAYVGSFGGEDVVLHIDTDVNIIP